MLSAYVEVLLCVIELLAFVAFKNTTASPYKYTNVEKTNTDERTIVLGNL